MENIRNKFEKLKETIIVLLLAIWMMIPIFKSLRITWFQTVIYEYTFIKIVGVIGVFLLIFEIFKNLKNTEDKKKYDKEILPITILGIFMIWTFISCIFSPNIENAFFGTEYRKDGYITYLCYAGFFGCAMLIKSKQNKKILFNIFIIVAIMNAVINQLRNIGILENIWGITLIDRGPFFQFNHYGYYLLMATVTANFLFITEKNKIIKILYLLSYMFLGYNLIINNTLGCYLALVGILTLFLIYTIILKNKRFIATSSIIIFVFISLLTQQTRMITQNNIKSLYEDIKNIIVAEQIKDKDVENKQEIIELAQRAGTGRMVLWKCGIRFFLERPILGYGPENLETKYLETKVYQDRPHNLIIQLATTSGIIGLIAYLTAIGIILIRGLKIIKIENPIHVIVFANVITYLMSAMFGNSMYYTSPYFFIFLGILMCENVAKSRDEQILLNNK